MCDTLVAMGIHRASSRRDRDTPFWYHELRKQLLAICYCRDTAFSYSLGRPPRLLSKFCILEPPLDISVEDLLMEGEELQNVETSVNADGWNTKGTANRVTWLRIRQQYCRLRESILEIALGTDDGSQVLSRTERIRQDLRDIPDSYPPWVNAGLERVLRRLNERKLLACVDSCGRSNELSLLSVHLGLLQTEFLLERALITRGFQERKMLVSVSQKILDLILSVISVKDMFQDFPGDVASLVSWLTLPRTKTTPELKLEKIPSF